MILIPKRFTFGGQDVAVQEVDSFEDNKLGVCCLAEGLIKIAKTFNNGTKQSESSKLTTFYHELTHLILDTMGEDELSQNEKFVSTFSSFLTQAIRTFNYEEGANQRD